MPINKFDGDLFTEKMQRKNDLPVIRGELDYLSHWLQAGRAVIVPTVEQRPTVEQLYVMQTKEERIEMILLMLKTIEKRKRRVAFHAAIRAVIVPAVLRAVFIFLLCAACFR